MKKKLWIAAVNILIICLCIFGTYAAYTSRSYVKGVAATPKQGLGLSSDYLVVLPKTSTHDNYAVRKILLEEKSDEDDTPYTISFYIQNSSYGAVNDKVMQYTFYISGLSPNASITRDDIDITASASSGEGAQSPAMPAYIKTTHLYKISIPKDEIRNIPEIVVKAVPDADSDSSGNMIAARIQASVAGKVAGFSYQYAFIDETADNKPADFAAFNYEVLVFNATEAHHMRLSWDTQYVEIDPLFLQKIEKVAVGDTTLKHVEFDMDAERDSYLIRFYRMEGQSTEADWQNSWDNLKNHISFTEIG